MKILHIASHKGNVGDLINHKGFYRIFSDLFYEKDVDKVELRDFYFSSKHAKTFDENFADEINKYDLCVLGGGGFFDAQWEKSETGVTLDFSADFIHSIQIPVLINAMGYHEYPGITNKAICDKFSRFLSVISRKSNWFITVRNDGSYERIKNRYAECLLNNILKVPDNAFFCPFVKSKVSAGKTLGLCITNDLFSDKYNNGLTEKEFNLIIVSFIEKQIQDGWKIMFFPHTPSDISIINYLMKDLSDDYKRKYVMLAPYDAGSDRAVEQLGVFYNLCDYIIGMRFHSLITAINLHIPAIALAGHAQIEDLYTELGMGDYCVRADGCEFGTKLQNKFTSCIRDRGIQKRYDEIYERLNSERDKYREEVFVRLGLADMAHKHLCVSHDEEDGCVK